MDRLVPDLLDALGRSARMVDVLGVVLARVVADAGFSAGVLALRSEDGAIDGVATGVGDDVLDAFLAACRREPEALEHVLGTDSPRVLHDPDGPYAELGFDACVALPIEIGGAGDGGVAILDADRVGDRHVRAHEILRAAGSACGRYVRLERTVVRMREVEHQRNLLTDIVDALPDPVVLGDADGEILLANDRADRLFSAAVAVDDEDDGAGLRAVRTNDRRRRALLKEGEGGGRDAADGRANELTLVDPADGSELVFEAVSIPLALGDATPDRTVLLILREITEVRRAAENERLAKELRSLNDELEDRIRHATEELEERNRRLERQSRELEKASRLKSEFLANMSHELRTPINALLGYAAILREGIYGDLTDQQETALAKISIAAQHLLALINDILDLSKIEAGKMLLTIEEIRIERVIDEVCETIEPLVREKSLDFDLDLGLPLPAVKTDATKLRQVLLNLLSNAVKFTHEGRIALRAESRRGEAGPDGVRIRVEDTGIGIKPEELESIFDDFRQVDQSATREYGGTGLGLSITKKLLSLLGGTISVESELGKGACFTVELPLEIEQPAPDEQLRRAVVDTDRTVVKG